MRVVLAGGGSAGHIEPALALADALRQADSSIQVTCLGTQRGLETRLVPLRGYELELIPAVPLPRSVTPQLLTVPGRLAGAVHGVGTILDRVGADVLVGFGGYVATPAYLAAKRHKVPIVVHEANPLAGIANRLGAHLTTHVFTGHPDTKLRNGKYLGLPIRRQIAELDRFALGDKARAHFGLRPDLPVLLVTGGSQGAVSLNRALAGAVSAITSAGVQVLHVTGPKHLNEIQAAARPGAVRGRAVRGPDGPGLRGGRLRAVPGRRHDVRRAHRRGPARRLRPAAARQRGAAAERAADRAARRRAAGRRRGADRRLDQDLAAPGADQHRPGGRHVGGGGRDGQEGRRPLAGEGGHRHRRRRGGEPSRRGAAEPASRPAAGRRRSSRRRAGPPAPRRPASGRPRRRSRPPRPPAEPGSLFTPRTTRHQQGAGGAQQPAHAPGQAAAGAGRPAAAGRPPARSSPASPRPARGSRTSSPARQVPPGQFPAGQAPPGRRRRPAPAAAAAAPQARPRPAPQPARPGTGPDLPEPESGSGTSPAGTVIAAAGRGHARWRW